jgi:hypothetical protein
MGLPLTGPARVPALAPSVHAYRLAVAPRVARASPQEPGRDGGDGGLGHGDRGALHEGLLGYRAGNGGAGGEVKVAHTTFPVPPTVV